MTRSTPADAPEDHRQTGRRRFMWWLSLTLILIASIWLVTRTLSPWVRLGVNATDSLPGLIYAVLPGQMPRGRCDLVAFFPPPNRFYTKGMVFIKKVTGIPGDIVSRQGRNFYIDGLWVAYAKPRAHNGVPLAPGPTGIIPEGKYFVWTPHPDSYDSRYADIGWISKNRFIGRAVRLF